MQQDQSASEVDQSTSEHGTFLINHIMSMLSCVHCVCGTTQSSTPSLRICIAFCLLSFYLQEWKRKKRERERGEGLKEVHSYFWRANQEWVIFILRHYCLFFATTHSVCLYRRKPRHASYFEMYNDCMDEVEGCWRLPCQPEREPVTYYIAKTKLIYVVMTHTFMINWL